MVDIVFLLETKLEWITKRIGIWGCPYVDWLYLDSEGVSSGILNMWNFKVVEKVEKAVGQYLVSCRFRNVGD